MENYNNATSGSIGYLGAPGAGQNSLNVKGSRINTDIEHLLALARSVNGARDRVLRHTSTLGYFSDNPPTDAGAKVSPISNTLQSAILELDRAVDGLSTALALFE